MFHIKRIWSQLSLRTPALAIVHVSHLNVRNDAMVWKVVANDATVLMAYVRNGNIRYKGDALLCAEIAKVLIAQDDNNEQKVLRIKSLTEQRLQKGHSIKFNNEILDFCF